MHTEISNQTEELASLSDVTPTQTKKRFNRYFIFALLVSLAFIGLACFPRVHASLEEQEAPHDEQKALTLSQNLALIEKMTHPSNDSNQVQEPVVYSSPVVMPAKRHQSPKLSKETITRMNAPTTFFNAQQTTQRRNHENHVLQAQATLTANNADAQFVNQQNDITSVSAKRLPHPTLTVPAGEIILATLETAINSELPGMVRAIVAQDIYSLQGSHCLIAKGSTLVGQFNSQVVEGQSRILVVWNRVQLANGVIVTLNSPGTDSIGRAGQGADYIDRHFFERFGTSTLLSVLGAYTANSGVSGQDQYNSQAQYRSAIASSFQQTSGQLLQGSLAIQPTLQINQGTKVNVFVAHDLDFHGVGADSCHRQGAAAWK